MSKFSKRWIAAGVCAGLSMLLMTGCSSTLNKDKVVATFGDTDVTVGEAAFWLRFNQAASEASLGALFGDGNMWEQDLFGTGEPYGSTMKEQVLADLEEMVVMEAHAGEYGVELTEEELAAIDTAVAEFMAANSAETLKAMYADKDTVSRVLYLNALRNKLQPAIQADVDTNVTDEEAAQKTIEYVSFSTSATTDEDGNTVERTDEEKEAIHQQAADVIAAVNDGATLEEAVHGVDENKNVNTLSYGEENTTLAEALREAADQLSDGEIVAEPVEYSSGWYVVRMVTTFDKEATEERKDVIVEERKANLLSETLVGWEPETSEINSDLWEKVTFDVGFNAPEIETESTAETEALSEADSTEASSEEETAGESTEEETTETVTE